MVEGEEYCVEILTQISAMTKALQSVRARATGRTPEPLRDRRAAGSPEADRKVKDASDAIARLVRS